MKRIVVVICAFILLSTFANAILFDKATDTKLIDGAEYIIACKVVWVAPAPTRSLYEISRQDMKVKVLKSYRGNLKKDQVIRIRINIMDARLPVFKDAFISRRTRGKEFLAFLYKSRGGLYKPAYGPAGFLKYKKSLKKRFPFLRTKKVYKINEKKSFIDRIIFEH